MQTASQLRKGSSGGEVGGGERTEVKRLGENGLRDKRGSGFLIRLQVERFGRGGGQQEARLVLPRYRLEHFQ